MTSSSYAVRVDKIGGENAGVVSDDVAVEEPLEIQLSSLTAEGSAAKSISITMRTPGDDADLATGFLLTEGIITSYSQISSVSHRGERDETTGLQNIVRVELQPDVDVALDRLQRHFYTTSSCGVCGKASLDALRVAGQASLAAEKPVFDREILLAMPDRVRQLQPLFDATGGLHAAAIFSSDGEIIVVKEDVGRHNATDKVIGHLLANGLLPGHGYGILVSGRASFELMQKALVAGIPLLAAVGAPSSLAVETAVEFGMTLAGFLRGGTFNVYAGANRIGNEA